MSRSRRKPIIKDSPRNEKKSSLYWRTIRRVTKQKVHELKTNPEIEIPNPKEIVDDYDYCDYTIDLRFKDENKDKSVKKAKRK